MLKRLLLVLVAGTALALAGCAGFHHGPRHGCAMEAG